VTRLVGSEALKVVTTRLLLWLGLLLLGLELLVIALHVSQDSLNSLAEARNQRDVVSIAAASALISLIVGIVLSAGEFTHGTVAPTFLVTPARERVVAAKLVVGALAGATLAAAAAAFAWGLAALLLSLRSVPLHLGSGATLSLLFGTIAAAAIAGALGVGFGSITRRQTAAIVVSFVWLLVVEPLLAIAGVQRYAPGHALASVVEGGTQSGELLSFGVGLALSLVYVLGFAVAGTLVVKGSDVS
jgi:ABC-2 type transport system permease protein